MSQSKVMGLAKRFAKAVGGTSPKYIGEHRWREPNESAVTTTHSPDEGVKVVCVVSLFKGGDVAVAYFTSDSLSAMDRFEGITHFTYRRANLREMVKDLKWVWSTVDRYARSWRTDAEDEE